MSSDQGESISSETSNGYLNEAEAAWSAFDEEADAQSTQSTHMDVMADPHSQRSLLLSHNEALAGIQIKNEKHAASLLWCGLYWAVCRPLPVNSRQTH